MWVVATAMYGAAFTMLGPTPDDYRRARFCFIAAGVIFGATAVMWDFGNAPTATRLIVVGFIGAVSLIGIAEGVRLTYIREGATETASENVAEETPLANQVPRPATPAPPPAAAWPDRIFVSKSITPAYLAKFYDDYTVVQADNMVAPYIGKWMSIEGPIGEIMPAGPNRILLAFANDDSAPYPHRMMTFDEKWFDRLSIMKRGEVVTVVGEIQKIEPHVVSLTNCELIEPF